jgi:hypothetical protein
MRAARGLDIVEITSRFEWQSEDDTFIENPIDEADILLNQGRDIFSLISKINHIPFDKLIEEQKQREIILGWMVENKISDYDEVIKIIRNYYHNPDEVYNMARFG